MKRALIGLLSMLIAACYLDAQQAGGEDRNAETNGRSFSENLAQMNLFNLYSVSDTSANDGKMRVKRFRSGVQKMWLQLSFHRAGGNWAWA